MAHKMSWKQISSGLSAVWLGVALSGCGGNQAAENTASTTTTTTQTTSNHGHEHKPGEAAHDHNDSAGHAHSSADDQATLAQWFPGATITKKPFPFNDDVAAHMGTEAGVKFTGDEKEWEIFEASKEGKRVGMAVMTHAHLPGGDEMHVDYAVGPKFTVSKVVLAKSPTPDKMATFVKQFTGKNYKAPFKIGKDLKLTPGVSQQTAQAAADTVHKGLVILEENFNPAHADDEHGHSHEQGDGHSHEQGADHKH